MNNIGISRTADQRNVAAFDARRDDGFGSGAGKLHRATHNHGCNQCAAPDVYQLDVEAVFLAEAAFLADQHRQMLEGCGHSVRNPKRLLRVGRCCRESDHYQRDKRADPVGGFERHCAMSFRNICFPPRRNRRERICSPPGYGAQALHWYRIETRHRCPPYRLPGRAHGLPRRWCFCRNGSMHVIDLLRLVNVRRRMITGGSRSDHQAALIPVALYRYHRTLSLGAGSNPFSFRYIVTLYVKRHSGFLSSSAFYS